MKLTGKCFFAILWLTACGHAEKPVAAGKQAIPPEEITGSALPVPDKAAQLQVDKIRIGMTIAEMKSRYPKATFKAVPVHEYGIDSEEPGLLVSENGRPLLFVWTLEESPVIHGISILSPAIAIDSGIRVGMTLEEFLSRFPKARYPENLVSIHMIDNGIEYSYIEGKDYLVEFLTTDSTRVGSYNYNAPEPLFIRVKRPKATIDRILVL